MGIAFLGTGLMGGPMALRLLKSGYEITAYNRTESKLEALKNTGASITSTAAEAIGKNKIIITMLTDYNSICSLLFENYGKNYAGKTVIQMSTISPDENNLIKTRIEKLGGEFLEAPVLGSVPQVESGTLFIFVGSTEEQFLKHKKLFDTLGNNVLHIGAVGKASSLKLAMNQLIISLGSAFSMSLGYILQKGIRPELFMEILRSTTLYASTFDKKLDNMLGRNFSPANFPLKHMLKDANLILNEFSESGIDTAMFSGIRDLVAKGVDEKYSELDYSAIYNVINPPKT